MGGENTAELSKRLAIVHGVFNVDAIMKRQMGSVYVQKYYWASWIPYWLWHNRDGYVHMGITRDGLFKSEDLEEGLRIIERYLPSSGGCVLELATGRGANAEYLATRHPDSQITGIDISQSHLRLARRRTKRIKNYSARYGDFHDLSGFPANQFDVVFVIEGLCYSYQKQKVLEEVNRVLRPGGFFVILDGYYGQDDGLTQEELLAREITVRGMALERLDHYAELQQHFMRTGFHVVLEEDATQLVVPTCERFERLATRFFRRRMLALPLAKVLPSEFTYNAITGYFSVLLFRSRACEYWITVLRKV